MAYHHGDSALQDTITRLAQNFPGSNNVPFMDALGAFGTAKNKEASAPRYIFTRLSKAFHQYFDKRDQAIVTHLYDDGDQIEPICFVPMIPTILVNGAEGTATGYKSSIAAYDAKDIRRALVEIAKTGAVGKPIKPAVNGWKGTIKKDAATGQISYLGVATQVHKTKLLITELPPKYDLIKYRTYLNALVEKDVIKDYTNQSTAGMWQFEVQCTREFSDKHTGDKLLEVLGLVERTTENVVAWTCEGKIRVFASVEELLVEWYKSRLEFAGLSLNNIIADLDEDLSWLKAKGAFVAWWKANSTYLHALARVDIEAQCLDEVEEVAANPKYLARLLDIKISQLAKDETESLNKQIAEKTVEVTKMRAFTPDTWYQKNLQEMTL